MPLHCYTLTSGKSHANINRLKQLANHEIEDSTIFVVRQLNIRIKANFHFELLSIAHLKMHKYFLKIWLKTNLLCTAKQDYRFHWVTQWTITMKQTSFQMKIFLNRVSLLSLCHWVVMHWYLIKWMIILFCKTIWERQNYYIALFNHLTCIAIT